jgi:ABC-type multidrug transport system fused ATPase/permease subunit
MVGQEPTLFARSVKENIMYGLDDLNISFEDVVRAAMLANAHSFIMQLADGASGEHRAGLAVRLTLPVRVWRRVRH